MIGIEKAEWPEILAKLKKSSLLIPPSFINNYDDWRCRSFAGRALLAMEDYDSAIPVLASVLDVEPDLKDKPVEGFSQAEHKVLCLMKMAEVIWGMMQNGEAALHYVDEAIAICEKFDGVFRSLDPLEVWQYRLKILRLMGQTEQAATEEQRGWRPACKRAEREVLDITEVRHRQPGGQGLQLADLGIDSNKLNE